MIDIMLRKGGQSILVRVINRDLRFAEFKGGSLLWANIDGIKFNVAGILKEFPDLEPLENREVLRIGKERFKEKIKNMKSEEEIKDYIIEDLMQHGYKPKYTQRKGHRIQIWKA